ncbi:metallophosphoesterase [Urechidicola vernalis]|uniref:Metallophosphoesterase n=1 Tax=Urechidicola vernalis TaxID=3075600 RepID=A0ABU2Y5E9_9FLAO|nr:metallophosphoesterase [Urechidicola sp. P050]MDT0552490.1 metallophosphoesterase [Urechidicola sp. P050]
MSRFKWTKLSILTLLALVTSCATYNEQHKGIGKNWETEFPENNISPIHTFYFLGDGGLATPESFSRDFSILKQELATATSNTTLLFLGDNIYDHGMPEKSDPERKGAEKILDTQIALSENFNGQTIFIPGNHDYYNSGVKGLKREADYITKKMGNKNAFLPKNGCPIKKVELSEELELIIIDSQWYLEDWDKNPTMNSDCDITNRDDFFEEFEGLLKKAENKTVLIALHHPMFSNGPHGGQFTWKQQLYPVGNNVPLPIVGTGINLLRKTSGASPQDIQNPIYLQFQKRMITLAQKAPKAVFVSGHEHNLQYIIEENKPQIISGSVSKTSGARIAHNGKFSAGLHGYSKVEVYDDGSSWVFFYTEENGQQKLLFKKEIFPRTPEEKEYGYPENFPPTVKTSIYTKGETKKGITYRTLWGEHYRRYYSTEITVNTVNLDTLFGGLTPIRKGGGHQSRSIRLIDKEGREYIMRAMRKSATQYFQEVAFKDQYIESQFDDTYTEDLLLDIYTMAHPYASFANATLANAVDVFHTNPKLYYIPKQNALKKYNEDYGDELYMIEERPAKGHEEVNSFGNTNTIINTTDFLQKLRKSDDYVLDESSYIRARLFDMAIGDWDRHVDQWRWAEFKKGKKTIFKPVPRDRDQAFSSADGFMLGFASRITRDLAFMQVYKENMRNVKYFNAAGFPLDITLLSESELVDWLVEAKHIQDNLTDEVINSAFQNLPTEVQDETVEKIKKIFKGRITNLQDIAEEYYNNIHKNAIVKGNDKDNWFDIERKRGGETVIKIYNIKDGKKGSQFFEKTFNLKVTKEIWIYGLDDDDVFDVHGSKANNTRLRIVGGQNNDTYNIVNGKKVTVYDYKSSNNTFETTKGKIQLIDDYKLNSHAYKRLRFQRNQVIPLLGINPDDGFRIGVKNIYSVYGFNGNPFTQQYTLNLNYYFETHGFDAKYTMEFANMIHDWNFNLEGQFTSPNYSINFFGIGNESENPDEELGKDYNRVRIAALTAYPSFKWTGRMGSEVSLGGSYEGVNVEKTPGRFIETQPDISGDQQDFVGVYGKFSYENYDNDALRTLGMRAAIDIGWKSNLGDKEENNGYIIPELSLNHKIDGEGKWVIATKMKGKIIIGDNFEFYNGASIGAKDGLRGYRAQRFTGKKSFYQNTDLRLNFQQLKTRLLPLKLGVLAGFDYGRVWAQGENSNKWHTSYGVGFWVVGAEMINLNFSIFNSTDGNYARFGLGFGF